MDRAGIEAILKAIAQSEPSASEASLARFFLFALQCVLRRSINARRAGMRGWISRRAREGRRNLYASIDANSRALLIADFFPRSSFDLDFSRLSYSTISTCLSLVYIILQSHFSHWLCA